MPAKDVYHDTMIHALEKDGWAILRQQYPIRVGFKRVWIDLSVEKEDGSTGVFIEVKVFQDVESIEALRDTVGQYILYRAAMKYARLGDIPLYLAIPQVAFLDIFSTPIGKLVIDETAMNLVVFNSDTKVIEQWLPYVN